MLLAPMDGIDDFDDTPSIDKCNHGRRSDLMRRRFAWLAEAIIAGMRAMKLLRIIFWPEAKIFFRGDAEKMRLRAAA